MSKMRGALTGGLGRCIEVSIKFLHYGVGGYWDFPTKDDLKIINSEYVFFGPCKPCEIKKHQGYKFHEDSDAFQIYKQILKNN